MKMTLLELVQSILASLDSEEVNSITDTTESLQVAGFIRDSYQEIVAGLNLPETFTVFELEPSNDPTKPVLMYLPETVSSLLWLKYDKREDYETVGDRNFQPLYYKEPIDFITDMYSLKPSDPDVETFNLNTDVGSLTVNYKNNKHPTFYTVLEDRILLFDSYQNEVDTTLMANKTLAYGEKNVEFRMEDDFVPLLDPKQFSLLLNEAKSQAFQELKQTENPKAEQRARKGWIRSQREKIAVPYEQNYWQNYPNFGRRSYGHSRTSYLRRSQRDSW